MLPFSRERDPVPANAAVAAAVAADVIGADAMVAAKVSTANVGMKEGSCESGIGCGAGASVFRKL